MNAKYLKVEWRWFDSLLYINGHKPIQWAYQDFGLLIWVTISWRPYSISYKSIVKYKMQPTRVDYIYSISISCLNSNSSSYVQHLRKYYSSSFVDFDEILVLLQIGEEIKLSNHISSAITESVSLLRCHDQWACVALNTLNRPCPKLGSR